MIQHVKNHRTSGRTVCYSFSKTALFIILNYKFRSAFFSPIVHVNHAVKLETGYSWMQQALQKYKSPTTPIQFKNLFPQVVMFYRGQRVFFCSHSSHLGSMFLPEQRSIKSFVQPFDFRFGQCVEISATRETLCCMFRSRAFARLHLEQTSIRKSSSSRSPLVREKPRRSCLLKSCLNHYSARPGKFDSGQRVI